MGPNVREKCECTVPGLITEEGALSKEVSLEEVVHLSGALRGGLIDHCLTLLDDVKQVPRITLHHPATTLWVLSLHDCDCVISVSSVSYLLTERFNMCLLWKMLSKVELQDS